MNNRLIVSNEENKIHYRNGENEEKIDVTDEFKLCIISYLKQIDDKSFKEELRKLIFPGDEPMYTGPAIICPNCNKEISMDWLEEDMDAAADMLIIQGEHEADCPHCNACLEFELDGRCKYKSITVKFVCLKRPCETCGDKCHPEDLHTIDSKEICIFCKISQKKERKNGENWKEDISKIPCENCGERFKPTELKTIESKKLCLLCQFIKKRSKKKGGNKVEG